MNNIVFIPSFYAHIMNGFLLLIALIILYKNYSKINKIEPYKQVIVVLLFSLSIGIHSLSHLGMEKYYGYNPMSYIVH